MSNNLPRSRQVKILKTMFEQGTTSYLAFLSGGIKDTDTALTMPEIVLDGLTRPALTWTDPATVPDDQPVTIKPEADAVFGPLQADMTTEATVLAIVSTPSGDGEIYRTFDMNGAYRGVTGDVFRLKPEDLECDAQ